MMNFLKTTQRYQGTEYGCAQRQPGRPTVEELQDRYAQLGLLGLQRTHTSCTMKPRLTERDIELINRLRATHTLRELGRMFNRHPSNIASVCRVKSDFRGERSGNWRRASA